MISLHGNVDFALSRLKGGSTTNNTLVPNPNFKYATPVTAYTPNKYASRMVTGQSQITYTQPQFYSPLHTPQNWQIPSKRREVYQWTKIKPCVLFANDFTAVDFDNLDFKGEAIQDSITGGIMFDNVECEPILSSSGVFRKPCKLSIRDCTDKDAIELKATGYWRTLNVTADDIHMCMNGRLYREKLKLTANEAYRRKKGMPPGEKRSKTSLVRDEKILIQRKKASEFSTEDYLLFPCPMIGTGSISADDAWLIGACIADGTMGMYNGGSSRVAFTKNRDEPHVSVIEDLLSAKFNSKIGSKRHGEGKGWRVTVTTEKALNFFSKYITKKGTNKKFTKDVFFLDKTSILNVLGGYFDGDGSFDDAGKIVANNYSMDMADQLYAMLLAVGIRASLQRHPLYGEHYPTNSEWVYRIVIPSSDVPLLQPYMRSEKIPSDFSHKKERNLRFFYEENGVVYLAQPIEYIKQYKYTGPGYDLEIRPEHAFVLNGYVTSNCRYFVENEPKVGAAIDFYSEFPINGFETQCDDSKIKRYFDNLNKKLNLDHWCKMISREYHLIGDVFPFVEIGCEKCGGTNVVGGKRCTHPGGTFNRIVVLNPDWIDVQQNQFVDDPVITLMPDDELKRVVWQKRPKQIYDRLPPHIRQLILAGKPIPLDPANISHIKHDPYPYGVYGTSLIRRLFKVLTYKDKLMTAQWIVAERLILPVRIVKVGNDERPAGASDLADVQQQLAQTAQDPNLTLITHHALEYDWIGASGKVLTLSNEFELINKEILQGLMLNDALLDGTMAGYQSSAIGAEALIQRLESWRLDLARWIEEHIYKPVAQMRGFIDEEASKELGEPVWIYPKIKWNDLNIRDDTQQKGLWLQLHERQLMSGESLLEKFDLDYDQEIERIRIETANQQIGAAPGMGGGMGAAPPGGGMGGDLFGGGGAGGAGGMPPPGGEMPGAGGIGMGGEAGGMPPPGGEMGGAPPPAMGGTMGKILPAGRAAKNVKTPKEEIVQPAGIKLTSLEGIMWKMLLGFRQQGLPLNTWVQFPLGRYRADFAIPQIKLAIECDGEAWHSHPDKRAADKLRDTELAKYGWTTVRFSEAELKEQQQAVKQALLGMIHRLWQKAMEAQEKQKKSMQKIQELAGETKTSSVGMIVEAGLENNRPPIMIEGQPPEQKP